MGEAEVSRPRSVTGAGARAVLLDEVELDEQAARSAPVVTTAAAVRSRRRDAIVMITKLGTHCGAHRGGSPPKGVEVRLLPIRAVAPSVMSTARCWHSRRSGPIGFFGRGSARSGASRRLLAA